MEIRSLLAGAGVLLAIVWIWFAVYYWLNPQLKNPEAKARMTGTCGDTMEIGIQFDRKHVAVETCCWTDGCIFSLKLHSRCRGSGKRKISGCHFGY